MKHLFSLVFGTMLGGLVALLSSRRKGTEVRADLKKAWEKGESGMDVLMDELKGIADGSKEGIDEFRETEMGQKTEKEIKKAYGHVSKLVSKAKKEVDEYVDQAKEELMEIEAVNKTVKGAQKAYKTVRKTAKKVNKTVNKVTGKKVAPKSTAKKTTTTKKKTDTKQ